MSLTTNDRKYETDVLCAECMVVALGDCENLFIEEGMRTVISNGKIVKFIYEKQDRR
jgi:hypothetical protein